ncbi:hypothetical protein H0H93_007278 [Arthromyces matolae]|nr:hypothetical protein H0H93_007278 [Arthromyces matolae]
MDSEDPISQFFPDSDSVDLYEVLSVPQDANVDAIKKAYRRLALIHHPDKHATATDSAKAAASVKFQQVGFAYAILSDEKRRTRYDQTGKTDEGFEFAAGENGWEAYFEAMFERVTRVKLDEMKKEYQGSNEELEDLAEAYKLTGGSIGEILNHIPHSTHEDEPRFIIALSDMITKGALPPLDAWQSSIKDEKAKLVRRKQGQTEAKEAEKLAKELGVWEEFYGSGEKGKRKTKGKGKAAEKDDDGAQDLSALQALILKKKQKNMDTFFDGLAAKYAEPDSSKSKKRGRNRSTEGEADNTPKKKTRKEVPQPPEIDDEEFERLQNQLFGDKSTAKDAEPHTRKPSKNRKKAS